MKLFFFGLVFTLFSLGAFAQETNTECAAMNNSREKNREDNIESKEH